MNTIDKLKDAKKLLDKVMERNQALETQEERHKAGFGELSDAIHQVEWAIAELENLYF